MNLEEKRTFTKPSSFLPCSILLKNCSKKTVTERDERFRDRYKAMLPLLSPVSVQ
jgi:hypothetical protein